MSLCWGKNLKRPNGGGGQSGSGSGGFGDAQVSAVSAGLEGVSVGITSELNADYRPYVYNLINCDFLHSAVGFSH